MSRNTSKSNHHSTPSPSRPVGAIEHTSAPEGSPPGSGSPPLITPVVRSKRTPIACTECRRRQVKCTGATPQCERCEKRGVKCEYIPCSQQRASSSASPTPPVIPERQGHHTMPFHASHSSRHGSTSWQNTGPSYQNRFPNGRTSYEQDNDWRNQSLGSIGPETQMAQSYFGGVPAHPRATDVAFTGEEYDQATYSYHTYGQPILQPAVPSHQSYVGGTVPSGFAAATAHLGSGDHSLSYGYGDEHGRASLPARPPSHRSAYSAQYLQGGNPLYGTPLGGIASDFTNQEWTPDPYPAHHGARYH